MSSLRKTVHGRGSSFSGVPYRTPKFGPEFDLVKEYIAGYLPHPPKGQDLTVFVEPEIETGFPDFVAVYWKVEVATKWNKLRSNLTPGDIKVAHFLSTTGGVDIETLSSFFRSGLKPSLYRLQEAGLVFQSHSEWRARSLRTIFAVRRLIAIEAKVSNWRSGLWQAVQNKWFASESYLLLPREPRSLELHKEATRMGVGIALLGTSLDQSGILPRIQQMPLSYVSWLFNEWAWRSTF